MLYLGEYDLPQFEGLSVEQRLALYEPIKTRGFKVQGDGREVCKTGRGRTKSARGQLEYKNRLWFVFLVYDQRCRLCGRPVSKSELTADHVNVRGMGGGSRDDRVTNLWPAHFTCNGRRGSRRIAVGLVCPGCGYDVVVGAGETHECFQCDSRWSDHGADLPQSD